MSLIETLAVVGISSNLTALAWIMKTLYDLRSEVSGSHGHIQEQIAGLIIRIESLERRTDPWLKNR